MPERSIETRHRGPSIEARPGLNPFLHPHNEKRENGALMLRERREHRRYQVKEGAFAIFRPEPVKILPIVDISLHGLSVLTETGLDWFEGTETLEILVSDCSFYLDKIPYRLVAESDRRRPDTDTGSRRLGLEFGRLSNNQLIQLKHFIRRHTVEGATPALVDRVAGFLDTVFTGRPGKEACHLFHQNQRGPFM
ncbi:MAG TPA: PilZ domain-containing protein [Desulfobacterales bacterium]